MRVPFGIGNCIKYPKKDKCFPELNSLSFNIADFTASPMIRGIWPGQIMSTHAFFFSDLMLQAIISFAFLRTLILFRIKIIQAKKNGYKKKNEE